MMRVLKRGWLIGLSGWLIIILGLGGIELFIFDMPQTHAGATFLAYSNDPNTGHVGAYGANPVIGFTDPAGTWFRICNGGTCTGYAQSFVQPQQYGGFKWIFDNANNGDLLQAQPQTGTGNAQCNIVIASGYRYCGVGMPDQDNDGVPDIADACPARGNEGNGIDGSGCPIPPPPTNTPVPPTITPLPGNTSPPPTDVPPNQPTNPPPPTPIPYTATPEVYTPGICEVAFLYETVYLRASANPNSEVVVTKSIRDRPLPILGATIGTDGFIWYQIPGAVPLFVREDVVDLGRPCSLVPDNLTSAITITPTYTPTPSGTPEPPPIAPSRSQPPEERLIQLGCPIQPGESISADVLILIVESPDPCRAKIEVVNRYILPSSIDIAKTYFDDTREEEQLFEKIIACNTPILDWVIQLIGVGDNTKTIELLIEQLIGDNDVCTLLEKWRSTPDTPIPIPPEIPVGDGINIGIMVCGHPEMTEARYNQLWNYLRYVWQMPIDEMLCEEINSANRIGTPTQDQLDLLGKLCQCRDLIPRPISLLEKFIMRDNIKPEWLNLSCEELLIASDCTDCAPIELPNELEVCILNDEDRAMMTLFIKNHAGLLNSSDLTNLYTAINPCHAVVTYLNTGIITPPILIPDPLPTEITPELPMTTPTPTQAIITQSTPASEALIAQEILLELGFDKPTGNRVQLKVVGVIFVRDNQVIIQENNAEKVVDADVQGEKYSPILFTINNRRVVAYIVVHDGQARIRMINLSSGDSTYAKLPDIITPHHESPLAYGGSMLVFTGIDPNGAYNLYGIPFTNTAQASAAVLLINNAMNATAVEGLSGFVFEQPDAQNNILLWIPGRQDFRVLDNGMDGECRSPVGERFGGKWRFWFLCDSDWGNAILHVNDMQSSKPMMFDIGSYLRDQHAETIIQLNLGELQGELFLSDGNSIFLYHQREEQPKVERFMRGAIAIFTFSRE